jgi:hypothetical protein
MQALDNFISHIPGFEGDILIPAILVSTRSPSGESVNKPSAGASAEALRTQTGKRKAATNPTAKKKTKKATEKSSSGIKINEPAPKAFPALTSPLGPRQKNLIRRSNRYTCYGYFLFLIKL